MKTPDLKPEDVTLTTRMFFRYTVAVAGRIVAEMEDEDEARRLREELRNAIVASKRAES